MKSRLLWLWWAATQTSMFLSVIIGMANFWLLHDAATGTFYLCLSLVLKSVEND